MKDLLKKLKRAYKAFNEEQKTDNLFNNITPNVIEKAFKAVVFRSEKEISDYELATTPDSYNLESITEKMKADLLKQIPNDFFVTTVEEGMGSKRVTVKLIIYKQE